MSYSYLVSAAVYVLCFATVRAFSAKAVVGFRHVNKSIRVMPECNPTVHHAYAAHLGPWRVPGECVMPSAALPKLPSNTTGCTATTPPCLDSGSSVKWNILPLAPTHLGELPACVNVLFKATETTFDGNLTLRFVPGGVFIAF